MPVLLKNIVRNQRFEHPRSFVVRACLSDIARVCWLAEHDGSCVLVCEESAALVRTRRFFLSRFNPNPRSTLFSINQQTNQSIHLPTPSARFAFDFLTDRRWCLCRVAVAGSFILLTELKLLLLMAVTKQKSERCPSNCVRSNNSVNCID